MRTNCASLVADLFLFCNERDFMKSLSRDYQTDIIEALNSIFIYLSEPEFYGDLVYKFKKIVGRAGFSDQFRKKYRTLQTYWI